MAVVRFEDGIDLMAEVSEHRLSLFIYDNLRFPQTYIVAPVLLLYAM